MNIVLFFVNSLIKKGKKQKSVIFLLNFLLFLKKKKKKKCKIKLILSKIIPLIGFINKTLSGKKYKIPCFLPKRKLIGIGLRWLIKTAKNRQEKTFNLKLLGEINDIILKKSKTVKQRNEYHALAFENKQYLYLASRRK